jgi:heme/copper-type cytochrome/quinol oxidase subunit 2
MLHLDVLQNQWLIFALVGGAAIVFAMILLFTALWRPREEEEAAAEGAEPVRRSFMPWVIILIFGATVVFMAAYAVRATLRPPNW